MHFALHSPFLLVFLFTGLEKPHLGFRIPPTLVMVALAAVLVAHPAETIQPAFDLAATLVVFPALIFLGACSVPTGSLARLFSTIGAASYAIYVLQAPLYEIAHRMALSLSRGSLPEAPWTILGLAFETLLLGSQHLPTGISTDTEGSPVHAITRFLQDHR